MSPLRRLVALLLVTAALAGACAAPGATDSPTPGATATATPTTPTDGLPTATPTDGLPTATPTEPPSTSPSPSGPAGTPGIDGYRWTELSPVDGPAAREDHTFTLAGDGQSAYVFGGRAGSTAFDDVWRYDLASDTWQQLSPEGDVPAGRFGHVAVWVEGHGLVVWSGQANATTFFDDIWAFDPLGVAWTRLPDGESVPRARYGSCGAMGPDGRLWISHGFTADGTRFSDTQAYDFAAGGWQDLAPAAGPVPVSRCLHDCLWTPDGRFLLYGGQTTGVPALGDLWTWQGQPAPGAWTEQPEPLAAPRQLYALAALGERAFIFGGRGLAGRAFDDLWLLDLATLAMAQAVIVGDRPAARSGAAFVADPARGRLVLFGGVGGGDEFADLWQLAPIAP